MNNVTLDFEFDAVYTDLTFDYEDLGGVNTIAIIGDKREYANTTAFFYTNPVIGGVEFTVAGFGPAPGGTRGTIRARGSFDVIALGGQEFTLDNINAVPAPGAAALLATAGVAATRRKR